MVDQCEVTRTAPDGCVIRCRRPAGHDQPPFISELAQEQAEVHVSDPLDGTPEAILSYWRAS